MLYSITMRLRNLLLIALFLIGLSSSAQILTGRWEGNLGNDEFLQINIIQTGDKTCGYTWDYLYQNQRNYCRSHFTGTYDKEDKTWFLNGTSFIENSGSHLLMQLKFKIYTIEGKPVLKGYSRATPTFFSNGGPVEAIRLEKISDKPVNVTQEMKDCVAENNPPKPEVPLAPLPEAPTPIITDTPAMPKKVAPPAVKKALPPAGNLKKTPTTSIPVKKKIIPPPPAPPTKPTLPALPLKKVIKALPPVAVIKKIDSVKKDIIKPDVTPISKAIPLPVEISGRKNKEIAHIIVHDKKITLNVYDNGTVDGDTVSIFYNGRLLINHQRLSGKPITVDLTLDENTKLHSIVLFAENLGSIPPNTALVIFTTPSGKRYELFSSATLQQNAEIIFEYIPL